MVHRLRSRPDRLLRQRRRPRLRAFARRPRSRQGRSRCACSRATTRCWRRKRTDATAMCSSKPACARRGRLAPAHAGRHRRQGRLRLPSLKIAGLRSHRPRRHRPRGRRPASTPSSTPSAASTAPARPCTSPRCCATRRASPSLGVPLTLVVERPDGVEYRRTVVAGPGRRRARARVPLMPSAPTGTWRVRAFTDPKRPPVGEATFLVEDYVPDRLEFELAADGEAASRKTSRPRSTLDGRYLYGAPAAELDLEGEVIDRAGERACRVSPAISSASTDEEVETDAAAARRPAGRPTPTARRRFTVSARQAAGDHASARGAGHRAHGRARRPRGRAQAHAAGIADGPDDRRQAAVLRPLARRGRERDASTSIVASPDGTPLARSGLRYELLKVETALPVVSPRRRAGTSSRSSRRAASPTARSMSPPTSRRASRCRCSGAATGSKSRPATATGRRRRSTLRRRLVCRSDRRHAGPARNRARQAGIRAGRQHDGRGHRAHRRQGHAQRDRRPAASSTVTPGRGGRAPRGCASRSATTGAPAPMWSRRCAGRSMRRPRAHARPRHRRAVVLDQPQGAHARAST